MRRRYIASVVALATALAVLPGAAAAEQPEDEIYLSLGTSLAAGTRADETGESIPFTATSYTDQLYRRVKGRAAPMLEHVKLGCPGETTLTMINGGICGVALPQLTYTTGSQLGDAQMYLATRDVALVTLDMGANDILQSLGDILACGGDQACIGAIFGDIASRIGFILGSLRAVDPDVPIVAMNYYNPNLATWLGFNSPTGLPNPEFAVLSDALTAGFGQALAEVYGLFDVPVVDVYSAFNSGDFDDRDKDGVPNNVERVCHLTDMCPDEGADPNIHANKRGYRVIAQAFHRLLKAHGII